MKKNFFIRIIVPMAITLGVIYFFFRDISPGDIKENFLKIPFSFILSFILLSLLATLLRAIKYHILLSKKLHFTDVFLITLVRNFSVDLLPARTASLILYTYLAKKKGLSVEEGAASFVVSVFYDALALVFMLAGLFFFLAPGINRLALAAAMGIILVISLIAILFSDTILGFLLGLRLLKRFPKPGNFIKNVYLYLRAHKGRGERLTLFGLSLMIRLIKYVFVFLLFEGVVDIGFSLRHFSLFSFGLAGTELSSLIPLQGLGGFGTWELAFSIIFQALAIPAHNLKEAGFVIHITTQVWEYSIGILALLALFFKKKQAPTT